MLARTITIIATLVVPIVTVAAQDGTTLAELRPHGDEAKAANLDIEVLHTLDTAMQKQVDNKQVSGVIGLIARHGKIGYFETFGQRVREEDAPMTKDTLFRIYSMTKPIVAVTAMSLWEEGKFKLDDPISVHLPEWEKATVKEDGKVVPAENSVTPRHLMSHSSGLSYNREELQLGRNSTLSEFSESLAKRPLHFHPGADYRYGYSIDILGRYIEAIEDKPLDMVIRKRVFDRLGMNDTEFWVRDSADRDRVATVYRKSSEDELEPAMSRSEVMSKPSRMMGGQGLMSTCEDYAHFCQMLLNKGELDGKRVLRKETVDVMFDNHLKRIGKVYGLGGMVDGKGGYSWGGAAGTKFWIDTHNDCCGVFMIQTWGYKTPTYRVFRAHVDRAILPGKE